MVEVVFSGTVGICWRLSPFVDDDWDSTIAFQSSPGGTS